MRIKLSKALVFSGFLFLALSTSANIRIERLDIQQPRSFGYQIGDKLQRVINLDLRSPYELDVHSLPKSGKLNQWLSVDKPEIVVREKSGSTQYTITLTYQIININSEIDDIPLPSHNVLYKDSDNDNDGKSFTALIPPSRLGISMLTDKTKKNIQPARPPVLLPQSTGNMYLLAAFLCCVLVGFAYFKWGLEFFTKNHPFAKACKALKNIPLHHVNDDQYRLALEITHRAFNETAGKTVFVEKLDEFFAEHSRFSSLQSSVEEYFMFSRKYFFEGFENNEETGYLISDLHTLVHQCAEIERGLA